ncbi:hypothetical protein Sru01_21000 [Sphaerisporangium rufum]|uniref:HTH lysR-type domain-containing protein n=1 Tax=Sphaerisporangium rufum TaxID=1381558 RepID=A0A919R0I6_9ACTN|nr:LysR family transcriptional regulator [Sphaerisporangium rufum]GII77118.1 hypothetical protein Sru01_21000 [Sphaerisporangium rufum]
MPPVPPPPSLRDVACLVTVARRLSFSGAATDLGMSQPAVSQAVARLERSFGVRLFERTSREVRPTPAGRTLVPYAEALLRAAGDLSAEAARLARPPRPVIRLAYAPPVGALAAQAARRLARRTPAIDVELMAAGRRAAVAALAAGEVAVAILPAPFPIGPTTGARFHLTVGHLAVPSGDPLAGAPRVRPDRLARYAVIMPGERPPGGMWARLDALLPGGPRRVPGPELDDFAAALDLVAAGSGVLPVPGPVVASVRRTDVAFVPLDAGDLRLTYGVTWYPERVTPELMSLVGAVQEGLWTR